MGVTIVHLLTLSWGGGGEIYPPLRKIAVTSKPMPRRGQFFATFSFYLLDVICEFFGIRTFLERKLQGIRQQEVKRACCFPIVKQQIENCE